MATRTISALGGNWNEITAWVEAAVPTEEDDVVATASSANLTITAAAKCKSADFTGYTKKLVQNLVAWEIYGSLTLVAGMTFEPASTRTVTFLGTGASNTITCAGKTLGKVIFNSKGTYAAQDNYAASGATEITHAEAKLDTSKASTVTISSITGSGTLKTGTETFKVSAAGSTPFNAASLTVEGSEATVEYTAASASSRKLNLASNKIKAWTHTVAGSTGMHTIEHTGASIGTINFSDASNARTLVLSKTVTLAVEKFNVSGTSGKLITIESSGAGTKAVLSKTSGTVECDYLKLKDSKATGGATWYAGGNSENLGNVEGWSFTSPKAPTVEEETASGVTSTAATLKAKINPGGKATTYVAEYGPTAAYGTKLEGSAGSGEEAIVVEKAISGLSANLLYHFRFVATNSDGTTQGADTIFCAGVGTESSATLRTDLASHLSWSKRLETTDAGRSTRLRHVAARAISDPRFVFGNPHATETIKVRSSLEITTGQYYPLHFSGEDANYEVSIAPETIVVSEPLGGLLIAKGTKFFSNTLIKPKEAAGSYYRGSFPVNVVPSDETGQRCSVGTTDYTKAENPGGGTNYGYGPAAIKGRLAGSLTLLGAVGDSVGAGNADSTYIDKALFAGEEKGLFTRAYGETIPLLNYCIGGAVGYQYAPTALRNQILKDCSHIFWQFGVNDLGDKALSAFQQGFVENWAAFSGYGAKAYATTITPHTESSDSFATTKNQTPYSARFGPDPCDRQTYNEWMRDGAPVDTAKSNEVVAKGASGASIARARLYNTEGKVASGSSGPAHPLTGGVIDLAAVVEVYDGTPKCSVWKVGTTEEGIHPTPSAHASMALALPSLLEESAAGIGLPISTRRRIVNLVA